MSFELLKSNPTLEQWNAVGTGKLPGLLRIEIVEIAAKRALAQLEVRGEHLAPNGYLHAATVIGIADTACGYGVMASLPAGAYSFTTIELKANFLATAQDGCIECEARLVHGGRTTQVWDAEVRNAEGKRIIALFRCTQLLLYPREDGGEGRTPTRG